MNLLFGALRAAIEEACEGRGLQNYRLAHRFNAQGEFVIAVITTDPRLGPERVGIDPPRRDGRPRRD